MGFIFVLLLFQINVMKRGISFSMILMMVGLFGFSNRQENTEFVCSKTLKAKNECHYNFLVDGGKFRFVDIGCKRKKDDVIEKAKAGDLPLAKDWKIECPAPKVD
jgi:hypothetical protein